MEYFLVKPSLLNLTQGVKFPSFFYKAHITRTADDAEGEGEKEIPALLTSRRYKMFADPAGQRVPQ